MTRPTSQAKPFDLTHVARLGLILKDFASDYRAEARLPFDPIEFPRRYGEANDIEVAGLIASALAYGRADLFKPRIEQILAVMNHRPAAFARDFARKPSVGAFAGIRYRFNEPADFAALVAAIGWMSSTHQSLGARFGALFAASNIRTALADFAGELRTAPSVRALLRNRGTRGLRHLLPDAAQPGACKRWNLYLRWMTRGPDDVDLGVWSRFVPTSALLVPLDTHIARIAKYLGLTNRSDLSWRTAEEITEGLRTIDPIDPVRFDFALCHHGMSGACPAVQARHHCNACPLRPACLARVDSESGPSVKVSHRQRRRPPP